MKWEIRKIKNGWGIFLIQKYCKTDEPVCYGVAKNKRALVETLDRLHNPIYEEKI
jgi:hypothetical protein